MLPRQFLVSVFRFSIVSALSVCVQVPAFAYEKAVEGPDVVLNKLYPKRSKFELDGKFGLLLNSSYQNTFLLNGSMTYFFSEEWGVSFEGNMALNSDKNERKCVESFYNDPNFAVSSECGEADDWQEDSAGDANWGPAYVPIRELKYILTANLVWNPIYGKQIVMLSATNYFDFYVAMGGGIAMSELYQKSPILPDGRAARGTFCVKADANANPPKCTNPEDNPGTTDASLIGIDGRPVPEAQTNVLAHLAVGQRFHFYERFLFTASLEDYMLIGGESGLENFLVLMGGLGVRF